MMMVRECGEMKKDYVLETIATYGKIASYYHLTATRELRAIRESSMQVFHDLLTGPRVLVPGCGEGRDTRYLKSLGLQGLSFDLCKEMLQIAKAEDPEGNYLLLDLRHVSAINDRFHGIWASGCLYHLAKPDFSQCLKDLRELLLPNGILFMNMIEGEGEHWVERPPPGYPGGRAARELLSGKRFYALYTREELLSCFEGFLLVEERRFTVASENLEFWLRKTTR